MRPRTVDRVALMAAYEEGLTRKAIAMRLGVPYSTVVYILLQAGIRPKRGRPLLRESAAACPPRPAPLIPWYDPPLLPSPLERLIVRDPLGLIQDPQRGRGGLDPFDTPWPSHGK